MVSVFVVMCVVEVMMFVCVVVLVCGCVNDMVIMIGVCVGGYSIVMLVVVLKLLVLVLFVMC